MVLLRSNQRHNSVSLGRSASLGSLQDGRNWKLEKVDVPKPPSISTANVTTTRNRRLSNPPSPHPSDYQFNPELDDYDDDLMEDSDSSDERENAHASDPPVRRRLSAVAIPITRSPTSTSSTSSNSSMSHMTWRQKIQHILHDRKHSLIGRTLRRIFTGALLISVVTMCLGTVDAILKDTTAIRAVYGVEAACLVVFTLELLLHIISAPNLRAIFNFSRLLDFLCVLPFYIDIIRAVTTDRTLYETTYEIEGGAWVRMLDLFRILRLFRVFPKSSKLRMMGTAFAHSIDGLWLLFYTIPLLIVLFSSLLFYAEQTESWFDENERVWYYDIGVRSPFQSIPDCFWLVIVTLTTIGYGDTVPRSLSGRLVCSAVMVMSLFVVAFPLTMITSQYALVADKYAQNRALLRKERAERAARRQQRRRQRSFLRNLGWDQSDGVLTTFKSKMMNLVGKGANNDSQNDEFGFTNLGLRRAWTAPETIAPGRWQLTNELPRVQKLDDRVDTGESSATLTMPERHEERAQVERRVEPPVHDPHGPHRRIPIPASILARLERSPARNHDTIPRSSMVKRKASTSSLDLTKVPTNVSFNLPDPIPSPTPPQQSTQPTNAPTVHFPTAPNTPPEQAMSPVSSQPSMPIPQALSVQIIRPSAGSGGDEPVMTVQIKLRDQEHLTRILQRLQDVI